MTLTDLSKDELRTCLATGASIAEIKALQEQGFDYAEILDLCETSRDAKNAEKQTDAERTALARQKLDERDNRNFPDKSVFSYPEGERAHPKTPLPFKRAMWGGTQESLEQLTAAEHELYLQLQRGAYVITKPDGSKFKCDVIVTGNDVDSTVELMDVRFNSKEHKDGLPSKVDMLRQMIAQSPRSAVALA